MPVPSPLAMDSTLGAILVGFACSCCLLGVVCCQCWSYIHRYPYDTMSYKALVAVLMVIAVLDQVFIGHAIYYYSITNWGNLLVFFKPPLWSIVLQVNLGSIAGSIVKAVFALRVYRFSQGNVPVTAGIFVFVLAQVVSAFTWSVMTFRMDTTLELTKAQQIVGTFSLAFGALTDIVTAIALCYFLRGLRTGYAKDDSLVNRMTLYAINTGGLTSAFSATTLILYDVMPHNFIFMSTYFVLSKLYVNSFLATLNTRKVVRGRGTDNEETTMPTFLMVGKMTKPNGDIEMSPAAHQQTSVVVEQEITITKDPIPHYVSWDQNNSDSDNGGHLLDQKPKSPN